MLEQFVIYDHPRDFPVGYVVRRWEIHTSEDLRPMEAWKAESLEHARKLVPARASVCITRSPGDDYAIVETWM